MNATTTAITQEEKRILIAQACGWKWINQHHSRNGDEWWFVPPNRIKDYVPSYIKDAGEWQGNVLGGMKALPDYFNDLNVIHEAEKSLDPSGVRYTMFYNHLHEICRSLRGAISATAAQRAEAFGLALKLWP